MHKGTATAEYQNPALFFWCHVVAEGMRLLSDSMVNRLREQVHPKPTPGLRVRSFMDLPQGKEQEETGARYLGFSFC